jgi:hypothetical protein
MYNVSFETLVNIAFTKIKKLLKKQRNIYANTCKVVREKNESMHLFAGVCMRGKYWRENN